MLKLDDVLKRPGAYRFYQMGTGALLDNRSVLVVTKDKAWYSHVSDPKYQSSRHSHAGAKRDTSWNAYEYQPEGRSLSVFAPGETGGGPKLLLLTEKPK